NCAHCHRRGGGGSAAFDVQYSLPLAKTNLLGARPTQGTFNIHHAQVIAPGDPYRSVLFYRMSKLGHGRMPQFGSQLIDDEGLKLIYDWIVSLGDAKSIKPTAGIDITDVDQRLATTGGALELATAIRQGNVAKDVSQQVIVRGTVHADP